MSSILQTRLVGVESKLISDSKCAKVLRYFILPRSGLRHTVTLPNLEHTASHFNAEEYFREACLRGEISGNICANNMNTRSRWRSSITSQMSIITRKLALSSSVKCRWFLPADSTCRHFLDASLQCESLHSGKLQEPAQMLHDDEVYQHIAIRAQQHLNTHRDV